MQSLLPLHFCSKESQGKRLLCSILVSRMNELEIEKIIATDVVVQHRSHGRKYDDNKRSKENNRESEEASVGRITTLDSWTKTVNVRRLHE